MKYSCLIFSEGGRDKKFIMALIDLDKFKYHTNSWRFTYDNASGSAPHIILERCKKAKYSISYDLTLCFIDLDKLKGDYPDIWRDEKEKLEKKYSDIYIIWQEDNAEDEYRKTLGDQKYGKFKLNKAAKDTAQKFINSLFWKKILKPIKDREAILNSKI